MTAPAVAITGLTKGFRPALAQNEVSLDVRPGEFVSLLSPSGCGKTTLLRIIAGFDTPTRGRVLIHGQDVTELQAERRPTNLVFQRGALFPHMTVGANIGYALRLRRWPATRIAARVDEMLALVRLDGLRDRMPAQLSGGQAQRVALARAPAAEPKVLLLDEPLSALDLKPREQMQLELRAIQRQLEAMFVFVTPDQTEALVMSDRIAILQGGRIVAQDGPASFIDVDGVHLTGPTPPGMATGNAAILLIRPEALRLRRSGEAILAARDVHGGRRFLIAEDGFSMATVAGARAAGLEHRIGRLEPGKRADIVIHTLDRPEMVPSTDMIRNLVNASRSRSARSVIIDGKIVLEDGRFPHLDERMLLGEIRAAAAGLFRRMGHRVEPNEVAPWTLR